MRCTSVCGGLWMRRERDMCPIHSFISVNYSTISTALSHLTSYISSVLFEYSSTLYDWQISVVISSNNSFFQRKSHMIVLREYIRKHIQSRLQISIIISRAPITYYILFHYKYATLVNFPLLYFLGYHSSCPTLILIDFDNYYCVLRFFKECLIKNCFLSVLLYKYVDMLIK